MPTIASGVRAARLTARIGPGYRTTRSATQVHSPSAGACARPSASGSRPASWCGALNGQNTALRSQCSSTGASVSEAISAIASPADAARPGQHDGHDHGHGYGHGYGHGRTVEVPTLVGRATIDADHLAPGPPSGAQMTPANGRTGPFPGQVIPGFSAMLDNGDGTFWAMPDNGFGAKANSADFLLRLYRIRPSWETASGGPGRIEVGRHLSLRDPGELVDFDIVNGATRRRLLTGADFDIESVVRLRDAVEGRFTVHVDNRGSNHPRRYVLSGSDDEGVVRFTFTPRTVEVPPGDHGTPPHRHSGPVYGYVTEGAIVWELEGEPERVIRAGEAFWEPGGDVIHYQAGNALADAWSRFVAVMVHAPGAPMLTLVDEAELAERRHLRAPRPVTA